MHWAKMEAYLLDMDFFWDGVTDDLKGNLSLSKCQHYFSQALDSIILIESVELS